MAEPNSIYDEDDELELARPPTQARRPAAAPATTATTYPRSDPRHAPPGHRNIYEGAGDGLGDIGRDVARHAGSLAKSGFPNTIAAFNRAGQNTNSALAGFRDDKNARDVGDTTRDVVGSSMIGATDIVGSAGYDLIRGVTESPPARFLKGFFGGRGQEAEASPVEPPPINRADVGGDRENSPLEVTITKGAEPGTEDVAQGGPDAPKPVGPTREELARPPRGVEIIRNYPNRGQTRSIADQSGRETPVGTGSEALRNLGIPAGRAEELMIENMRAQADLQRAGALDRQSKMAPITPFDYDGPDGTTQRGFFAPSPDGGVNLFRPEGLTVPFRDSVIVEATSTRQKSPTGEETTVTQPVILKPVLKPDGSRGLVVVPMEEADADQRIVLENFDAYQAILDELMERNPGREESDYERAALQMLRERLASE